MNTKNEHEKWQCEQKNYGKDKDITMKMITKLNTNMKTKTGYVIDHDSKTKTKTEIKTNMKNEEQQNRWWNKKQR